MRARHCVPVAPLLLPPVLSISVLSVMADWQKKGGRAKGTASLGFRVLNPHPTPYTLKCAVMAVWSQPKHLSRPLVKLDNTRCLSNWATVVCQKEELSTHWISLYLSY